MSLTELFGVSTRIKILDELICFDKDFLKVEEIARMADVSLKSVYTNMKELEEIGIVEVENNGINRYKLNFNDERVLALGLIATNEFLRKSNNYSEEFKSTASDELDLTLSDDLELNKFSLNNEVDNIKLTLSR